MTRSVRSLLVVTWAVSPQALLIGQDAKPASSTVRLAPSDGERVRAAALSPDGRQIAFTGEPGDPGESRIVRVHDTTTGALRWRLEAGTSLVVSLAFSSDNSRLLAGSADSVTGVRLFDLETGKPIVAFSGGTGFARFLDDGRVLVVDHFGPRDLVRIHDPVTGNETQRFPVPPSDKLEVTSNGTHMVAVHSDRSRLVHIVDVRTGRDVVKLEGCRHEPAAVTIDDRGRTVAAADRERILVWETATGRVMHELRGHEGRVLRLRYLPKADRIVSAGSDRTVRLWDLATGTELAKFTGHESLVTALAVAESADRVASGSFDRSAIVWNTASVPASGLPAAEPSIAELEDAWHGLGSDAPATAYRALFRLLQFPETGLGFLANRVHGTVVPAENERIVELIALLDHVDYVERHRATVELQKLRGIAQPILEKAYRDTASAEVRNRIRRILGDGPSTPRFTPTDRLRMLRIVHTAERSARPEATAILEELVREFPDANVVAEAQRALARRSGS